MSARKRAKDDPGQVWSWQPSSGWLIAIVAVILLLSAVILCEHSVLGLRQEEEISRLGEELESEQTVESEANPSTDSSGKS